MINSDNDVMSEIKLFPRCNDVRLVKPETVDISDIELPARYSTVRLINPDNDEMSEIELSIRFSHFRLIACSSPVKSLMLDSLAVRLLNAAISDVVMGSPDALPNCVAITARRLGSGIVTVCAVDVDAIERKINRIKVKR